MPTISRFYGMTIKMFYNDHSPPHFHVKYGDDEAVVGISPIALLHGSVPVRARSLVMEWASLHQQELREDWDRCREGQSPLPIEPLE